MVVELRDRAHAGSESGMRRHIGDTLAVEQNRTPIAQSTHVFIATAGHKDLPCLPEERRRNDPSGTAYGPGPVQLVCCSCATCVSKNPSRSTVTAMNMLLSIDRYAKRINSTSDATARTIPASS